MSSLEDGLLQAPDSDVTVTTQTRTCGGTVFSGDDDDVKSPVCVARGVSYSADVLVDHSDTATASATTSDAGDDGDADDTLR